MGLKRTDEFRQDAARKPGRSGSRPSSITTLIKAATRASTTSYPPTSTSDATELSWNQSYPGTKGKDQTNDARNAMLASQVTRRTIKPDR